MTGLRHSPAGRLVVHAIVLVAGCVATAAPAAASGATDIIRWDALRPATQDAFADSPAAAASIAASGETLSWNLDGRSVELSGYVLPVDRDGDLVYEFLLLPLTGLCSHVPAPPPNQIVHVFPQRPYRLAEIYAPISIQGTLKPDLETTQLFILDGARVIESGYSMDHAEVRSVESVPDGHAVRVATPWTFLKK